MFSSYLSTLDLTQQQFPYAMIPILGSKKLSWDYFCRKFLAHGLKCITRFTSTLIGTTSGEGDSNLGFPQKGDQTMSLSLASS
jgi:hypothetical protein